MVAAPLATDSSSLRSEFSFIPQFYTAGALGAIASGEQGLNFLAILVPDRGLNRLPQSDLGNSRITIMHVRVMTISLFITLQTNRIIPTLNDSSLTRIGPRGALGSPGASRRGDV